MVRGAVIVIVVCLSLHPILGLAEPHRTVGDGDSRKAFEQLWWSIAEHDQQQRRLLLRGAGAGQPVSRRRDVLPR